MLKQDNVVKGMLAGLALPAIAWVLFKLALKNIPIFIEKPAIPYLAAIAVNLFIIKYFLKKGDGQTGTGMIISTFVAMVTVFIFKSVFQA